MAHVEPRKRGGRLLDLVGRGLVIVLAFGLLTWTAPATSASSLGLSATYDVKATLNHGAGTLAVDSTATVTNATPEPVSQLDFNLAALRIGAFTRGVTQVDGVAAISTIDDQTITVGLPGPLGAGATTSVRITYSARLATNKNDKNWLFAKLNGTVQAYRWIPWLSRATRFNRPNAGDPFVTGVSPHVRVRITSERKLDFATSGDRTAVSGLTQTFEASQVRDFNFTARPTYQTLSARAAGVNIVVHYSSLSGTKLLNWAKRSVETFTRLVGPYPYPTLRVVETGGGHAMEAPAMAWIPRGSTGLGWLVAHEVAHQWFYAVVGNDQAQEPFADEALVTLLTREATGKRKGTSCAQKSLDRTIYEYRSCYYGVIYVQGADYLAAYRSRVGEQAFWDGIRAYYQAHSFGIGGTRQLLDTLDGVAPSSAGVGHHARFPRYYTRL
jgi:hypothetical protein